jgi:2-oxoglutarate ferredoxin oxidoreductase subunit delta
VVIIKVGKVWVLPGIFLGIPRMSIPAGFNHDEGARMKYWREPLDQEKIRVTRGRVQIIAERCKGCEFCISYCPRGVLEMSKGFNPKGYHYPEATDAKQCVNCHFCEVLCPEFAIFSVEEKD